MGPQVAHAGVELRDVRAGERAGRLVHDDDARVAGERFRDLDELAGGGTELAHRSIGIDVEAEALERSHRGGSQLAAAHQTERPAGPASEEEVVGGVHGRTGVYRAYEATVGTLPFSNPGR